MTASLRPAIVLLMILLAFREDQAGAQERQTRLRSFGRLPGWALESWYMRRQVEPVWALRGGNVIDVGTGRVQENVTIVITGDVIRSIGQEEPPKDAKVVDISGQYVIPGLFDLHAHVIPVSPFFPGAKDPEETLKILLDHGVTTIRLLPFHAESAHEWAARVNSNHLPGPTIVPVSGIFEKSPQRTSMGFGDPATARLWVQKEALLGARWIKVYNSMDEESLRAIVESARQYGLRVCGHTEAVPPLRAAELGIGSVEHVISLPLSCQRAPTTQPEPRTDLLTRTAQRWASVDDDKLAALLGTFRERGTAWVPTLVVTEKMMLGGSHDGVASPDDLRGALQEALRKSARAAVQFHRDGGLLGLGTDFPVDGVVPGESVHREMQLLVEYGGATPLEALQIATIGSARVLGFDALLGSVESRKIAHLVVLRGNPLEDISKTQDIALVVHDGRQHRTE